MILSIDAKMAFEKIQHSMHDRSFGQNRNGVTQLNIIKAIYDKLKANIIPNGEKLGAFSLRSGRRQGCLLSPFLFNIVLARAVRQEKEIKGIEKEEVKVSLFVDDRIFFYWRDSYDSKKLFELTNTFSKVAGYKINIQKSIAFLYSRDKQAKKDMRESIPFTIASKKIKYL